jgi:transposase
MATKQPKRSPMISVSVQMLLYRWKCQYQVSKEQSVPGTGNLKDAKAEQIRQLERQLSIVTEEQEILKKAFAVITGKTT